MATKTDITTKLPAPLPSLTSALSRRRALFGAAVLAAAPAAAAPALAAFDGSADARLLQLADAYAELDREVDATPDDTHLIDRFGPIEDELAETPAQTLAGVLAKARVMQFPSCRDCAGVELGQSVADDLVRIHGGAHA